MADTKLVDLIETSVVAVDDVIYTVDVSDTSDAATGSSRKLSMSRALGMMNHVCQGRLTTESGVAVSSSDRAAQSTLYFTPYNGNCVSLYDGTRWKLYTFTQITGTTLSGLTSGRNYDVFLYDNAGTLTLELSAAWNSDGITRTDAITTQDGVYVKSGSTSRRLVGTFQSTSTTATEDSAQNRLLWNVYNRVSRPIVYQFPNATSWTYSSATYRAANGSSSYRVSLVNGLSQDSLTLFLGPITLSSTATVNYTFGLGEDSSTVPMTTGVGGFASITINNFYTHGYSTSNRRVPLGYHYYQAVESSTDAFAVTVYLSDTTKDRITSITGLWRC